MLSELNIAEATNQELVDALKGPSPLQGRLREKVTEEIDRRISESRLATYSVEPFNPKLDISADARWLWKQVFIWFWIIPAIASILFLVVTHLN